MDDLAARGEGVSIQRPLDPQPDPRRAAVERGAPAYLVLVLAGIVFNIFSGNSKYLGLPIGLDRICFALGLTLLAFDVAAWRGLRLVTRPVLVLSSATLAIVLWSAWTTGTLFSSYGFFALLDRLAVPYLLFVLAPVIFRTAHQRRLLAQTLTVLGVYLGATAVFETLKLNALVFPSYINDPSLGILYGRARGPFLEPVADGLVLAVCAFAAAMVARRRGGAWRWVAIASMLLCLLGTLLTLTRAIWLGTALAVALVCLIDARLRRWFPALLVVGALGVAAALIAIPGLGSQAQARAGTERSIYDRQNTNAAALRIIEQKPLDGVGWTRFRLVSAEWVRQAPDYPITNIAIEVHNVFLGRAAELGLPGALVWGCSLLVGPVTIALRTRGLTDEQRDWRLVLIGALTTWAVAAMLGPLPYALPNLMVWLLAGMVAGPRDAVVVAR
jgi:putative inorganic carbon (HCO3(-)) transporter